MVSLTRADYLRLSKPELQRRLRHAQERAERADSESAYVADMFTIQEIGAVLALRDELAY